MKAPGRLSKTECSAHGGIFLHGPPDLLEGASFSLSWSPQGDALCCPLLTPGPPLKTSWGVPSPALETQPPFTSPFSLHSLPHPHTMKLWGLVPKRPGPLPAARGHGEARLAQHPVPMADGLCVQSLSDFRTRTPFPA